MHRGALFVSALALFGAAAAAKAPDTTPECTVKTADGTFYDLRPLINTRSDYTFASPGGQEFHINICRPVAREIWNAHVVNPGTIGAVTRKERGDFSIGAVNTTIEVLHDHPLIVMSGGSPCPKGDGTASAMTAVRFICDRTEFGAGSPELVAQLPYEDEHACFYFLEWRTHHACPAAKPGGFWASVTAVLAVIAMIALVGYIVGMLLYNRFVLKKQGFDQLPRISIFSFTDTLDAASGLLDRCLSGRRAREWRGDARTYNYNHHTASAPRAADEERQAFAVDEEEEEEEEDAPTPQQERHVLPQGMDRDGVIRM